MALLIPKFPNPFDPANPLVNAYGWLAGLSLDLAAGSGRVTIHVNPNSEAWQSPPITTIGVGLGDLMTPAATAASPPTPEVRFPSMADLMADPAFAAAYNVIGTKLYTALMTTHPALAGAQPA